MGEQSNLLKGMKVLITAPILSDGIDLLKGHGAECHQWQQKTPIPRKELLAKGQGYQAILCTLNDHIDAELLNILKPKVVANYAVGVNNIDRLSAKQYGVLVSNTPDCLTAATADLTLALMLSCSRLILPSARWAQKGHWPGWTPQDFLGMELEGKTLGILGMGRIGQNVAQKCHAAWKMKILYYSRTEKKELTFPAQKVDLQTMLEQSDFVSVHTDLNDQSRALLGERELAQMKKDSILINTARGDIIQQEALVALLHKNHFFSVGLDVTTPEPLPASHPLFSFEKVLITPHIGSATFSARRKMSLICAENIIAGLTKGQVLNPV